jgi:hypothetical protein
MSFGQEMKDFLSAYQTGSAINLNNANAAKVRSDTIPNPNQHPGLLSTIVPAFGAGSGGGVGTTTAPGTVTGGAKGAPGDPRYRDAISSIESGGNYKALGPWTGDPKEGKDRAYGRYQMMGANIPTWTKMALGTAMTPEQFLASPEAQDKTFDRIFGDYVSKYGEKGAAEAWFGGPGSVGKEDRKDVLGTTVKGYGSRFMEALNKAPKTAAPAAAPAASSAPASASTSGALPEPQEDSTQQDQADQQGGPVIDAEAPPQESPLVAPQVEDDPRFQNPGLYAEGGIIPDDTQYFAEGGMPNPSGTPDRYNADRAYTQSIAQRPAAAVPRRISFPVSAGTGSGAAPKSDWRNWGGGSPAQLKMRAAAAARPATPAPAPAAPTPAAPKPAVNKGYPLNAQLTFQPGAHGRDTYTQIGLPQQYMTQTRNWRDQQDEETGFARGGAVPRDTRFQELLRQESRGRSSRGGDNEGGESARDRAARRLSAEEKRPPSTAYRPGRSAGGAHGAGVNRFPAAPTPRSAPVPAARPDVTGGAPHVRHPPNPTVGARAPQPAVQPASAREILDTAAEALPFKQTLDRWGNDISSWLGGGGEQQVAPADTPMSSGDPMGAQVPAYARGGVIPEDDRFTPPVRNVGRTAEQGAVYRPKQTKSSTKQRPKSTAKPQARNQGKRAKRRADRIPTPTPRPDVTAGVPTPTPRPDRGGPILARPEGPALPQRNLGGPMPPRPEGPARAMPFAPTETRGPPDRSGIRPGPFTGRPDAPIPPNTEQGGNYPDVPPQDWSQVHDQRQDIGRAAAGAVLNDTGKRIFLGVPPDDSYLGYARGGVIPDEEYPPPKTPAEGAGAAPSATPNSPGYNERVAEGGTANQQVELSAQPLPQEVMAGTANAVEFGTNALSNIFGLNAPQGALPTPEDGARQEQGIQRFATGEGAATQQEVQAIDKTMGIDQLPLDEGMKNLVRIDQTVQYYLQNGDKKKAEAVAASLLQYGARRVGQYGVMAQAAFEHYQESGDPKDLQNAARALQGAHQMIPDGFNVKFDVDPKTHQLVATTLDADGKPVQQVIDPMAVPGLLKKAMDGSAYWESVFQVGQPDLAVKDAGAQATAANAAAAQQGRKDLFDYEQSSRIAATKETENRAAARKLWESDRELDIGKTENERLANQNKAYFDEWSQRMDETQDPAQRQQLTQEGLGYRYENTPDRRTALEEETVRFSPDSPNAESFDEADVPAIRNLARSIAMKNGKLDGPGAMEAAATLVMEPAPKISSDGTIDIGGWSLVFNPALLPTLGALHKKYGAAQ